MTVVVLGSINQDVVSRVVRLPRAGETVSARETLMLPGGKGANQAIAAARMGAGVRMLGAVGADANGDALTRYLAEAGVDTAAIRRIDDVGTGAAYITIDDAGENQIVVSSGANARVAAADVGAIDGVRVALGQLETPVPALAAFFAAAAAAGALRILNAAPALPEGAALFAGIDVLIVNQTELAAYLDLAEEPRTAEDAAVARRLIAGDLRAVIVTLGAAGAVLVEADALRAVPARPATVVDTTGAGDCFCGVLAALAAEGMPLGDAIATANAAAAICVGRAGAGPAMPTRAEVEAAL